MKTKNKFHAVKTNDVVWFDGKQHVVVGVDMTTSGVVLQIQPVSKSIKAVSYEDVQFSPPELPPSVSLPQRLFAGTAAQGAMQQGFRHAFSSSTRAFQGAELRRPYTDVEVVARIKELLVDALSETGEQFISQKALEGVAQKVALAQGYLIGVNHRLPKQSKPAIKYATWQDIASIAVKIANNYNKMVLSKSR